MERIENEACRLKSRWMGHGSVIGAGPRLSLGVVVSDLARHQAVGLEGRDGGEDLDVQIVHELQHVAVAASMETRATARAARPAQ